MWQDRKGGSNTYEEKPFNSDTDDSQPQRDRARIIHSSAFRRLQAKTQVLGIGENDFYRTRLTHSLEVAQIGSGICEKLREKYASYENFMKWIPSLSQIEAICLAHDIGHPPFGHGGELALNFYMHEFGGFEGNGQTLRIVSKLGEYSPSHGFDLTRRTMLGLIKYPVIHQNVGIYENSFTSKSKINIDAYKPPKCIHDEDKGVLDWVLSKLPVSDIERFQETKESEGKIKSKHKAFDTSIMELADDISYGVHDLEDALALNLVTEREWEKEVIEKLKCHDSDDYLYKKRDFYTKKLFSNSSKERKHAISKLIGYFIPEIEIIESNEFETCLLSLQARLPDEAVRTLKILKDFIFKYVIKRPEVQALEYKGQQIILSLFEVLQENPERLLPLSTYEKYTDSPNNRRVISDYISGMTDSYATKLYHKLFSPDMGSIFDRM